MSETPQPAEPIVAEKTLEIFHLERELATTQAALSAAEQRATEAEAERDKVIERHKSIMADHDERYAALLNDSNAHLRRAEAMRKATTDRICMMLEGAAFEADGDWHLKVAEAKAAGIEVSALNYVPPVIRGCVEMIRMLPPPAALASVAVDSSERGR